MKTRYAATAFDGEGARRYGGRWNSPGVRVSYASDSIALAVVEVLVHLQTSRVLGAYSLVSVSFPDELVTVLEGKRLPGGWRRYPAPPEIQAIGDSWIADSRSAVLRVPSVVVPDSYNFLLNPGHPEFARVVVGAAEPFAWDPRLLG